MECNFDRANSTISVTVRMRQMTQKTRITKSYLWQTYVRRVLSPEWREFASLGGDVHTLVGRRRQGIVQCL